jgi:hypothetical protein
MHNVSKNHFTCPALSYFVEQYKQNDTEEADVERVRQATCGSTRSLSSLLDTIVAFVRIWGFLLPLATTVYFILPLSRE